MYTFVVLLFCTKSVLKLIQPMQSYCYVTQYGMLYSQSLFPIFFGNLCYTFSNLLCMLYKVCPVNEITFISLLNILRCQSLLCIMSAVRKHNLDRKKFACSTKIYESKRPVDYGSFLFFFS